MPTRSPTHRPPWWKPHEQTERERQQRKDANRPSSVERGYDSQWRALRLRFITYHPTCSTPRCGKPATDVDHIESIKRRPDLRFEWRNLRALCHACHSRRTARDQGFGFARSHSPNEPRR
jgi:5-methylcytosine-specific restriction endonuclease McrA